MRYSLLLGIGFAFLATTLTRAADQRLEQIKAELKAQVDADVNAIKAKYEERIEGLEKRINTLEADNSRLKKQKCAGKPLRNHTFPRSRIVKAARDQTRADQRNACDP